MSDPENSTGWGPLVAIMLFCVLIGFSVNAYYYNKEFIQCDGGIWKTLAFCLAGCGACFGYSLMDELKPIDQGTFATLIRFWLGAWLAVIFGTIPMLLGWGLGDLFIEKIIGYPSDFTCEG